MAMTAKEQEQRWREFVNWYKVTVSAAPGGPPAKSIPGTLKKLYMANDGAWGTDRALQWIRLNDPNWLRTKEAQDKEDAIKGLYEQSFGYKINWKDPVMKRYVEGFSRTSPNINVPRRLTEIFMKRILPSKKFKTQNPGFASWLNKNRQNYKDANSIIDALTDYNAAKETLTDYWATQSLEPMPKELLDEAIANDWEKESLAFQRAMTQSKAWASGASYQDRAAEFTQNWKAIFGEGSEPDPNLQDTYARNNTGLTFSDYFHTSLKNSSLFKQNMPGYQQWEAAQHAAGKPEGAIDVFDYFSRRNELVEMWNENFTAGELPDQAFLDEAMTNNWGDALFLNKLRRTDAYKNSGAGKQKSAKFDSYWRKMFGETAVPNETIKGNYMGSDNNDPSVYWDDIKGTDEFKKQYANWDVFANAQAAIGVDITEDPMEYKAYLASMKNAFTNIGMEMPEQLERNIFASGVSGEDLQDRASMWNTTKEAYQLQEGEKADLVQTMGVGTTQANSTNIRDRLVKALEKQKTYSQSKFAIAETKTENDMVTQKI